MSTGLLLLLLGAMTLCAVGGLHAQTVVLPATASVGVSSFQPEKNGGDTPPPRQRSWTTETLRLRQNQNWSGFENHVILLNFDLRPIRGWSVQEAWLHLALAKGDLFGVGACTVLNRWDEVEADGAYAAGAPCWDFRSAPGKGQTPGREHLWAWKGSGLFSVAWFHPAVRYSHAGPERLVRYTDEKGQRWIKVPLDPALVHALACGVSHGLVLTDDKGQVAEAAMVARNPQPYSYDPAFEIEVYGRKAGPDRAPRLEVQGGVDDRLPPAAPKACPGATPRLDFLTDPDGAVWVDFLAPDEEGTGKAFAYEARLSRESLNEVRWDEATPVPRHDLPRPAPGGTRQRLRLSGCTAGRWHLGLRAIDDTGQRGPILDLALEIPVPAEAKLRRTADPPLQPGNAKRLERGAIALWAVDELAKVDPVTGGCVGLEGLGYQVSNPVWNAADRTVRLRAARNEVVAFQLVVERLGAALREVRVSISDLRSEQGASIPSAGNVELFREWYLKVPSTQETSVWRPDACLPLAEPFETAFSVPAPDNVGPEQRNQAVWVDLYVPMETRPGLYRGTATVRCEGLEPLELPIELRVRPFALPHEIGFPVSLNAYGGVSSFAGVDFAAERERALRIERSYYRLAHRHRGTLDLLRYQHSGQITENAAPPLSGEGAERRVADWRDFDARFGPLLDGSAFAEAQGYRGPGQDTPVAYFYLPWHENWPMDLDAHYADAARLETPEAFGAWARRSRPLEQAIAPAYVAGTRRVLKDLLTHFAERGWTRTRFEFFLNNKYYYKCAFFSGFGTSGRCYWLLDESIDFDDFDANRFFQSLAREAVAEAGAREVKTCHRVDISYPHLARGLLDGVADLWCSVLVGEAPLVRHLWMPEEKWMFYTAGAEVGESGHRQVQLFLRLYAWGISAVVPYWNVLGKRDWVTPDQNNIFYTGKGYAGTQKVYDGAIAGLRLKHVRRAQQDVEYAILLSACPGWDHDRVVRALSAWAGPSPTGDRFDFTDLGLFETYRLREALAATIEAP